jgi:pimeloyl-ACP methyl ester carboxylesterase
MLIAGGCSEISMRLIRSLAVVAALVLAVVVLPLSAQRMRDFTTPTPLPPGSTMVIGFLGGVEEWNGEVHRVRRLALDLRGRQIPGIYVETVENHHRDRAIQLIKRVLDQNRDGRLDDSERNSVRIILYGHSMGGAAVVKSARELEKMGVPVALTVQIDSVGLDDAVIPPNVARAANLYQHEGKLIHGRSQIRAEDPQKTEILGNLLYSYRGKFVDGSDLPLHHKVFPSVHMKMERDPEVWDRVESYILAELHRPSASAAAAAAPH